MSVHPKRSHPSECQLDVRLRKCRKGTQSCWACKKRKIRCIFGSSKDTICESCKRRNVLCISQEYPDDPTRVDGNSPLRERLDRVETLLARVAHKVDLSDESQDIHDSREEFEKQTSTVCALCGACIGTWF